MKLQNIIISDYMTKNSNNNYISMASTKKNEGSTIDKNLQENIKDLVKTGM